MGSERGLLAPVRRFFRGPGRGGLRVGRGVGITCLSKRLRCILGSAVARQVEEALQVALVVAPLPAAAGHLAAQLHHALHLGVHVVEVMEEHGLGRHGQHRRTVGQLAVVAEDEVGELVDPLRAHPAGPLGRAADHLRAEHQVAHQPAPVGVADGRPIVGVLLGLGHVVEEHPGEDRKSVV